MLGKDAGSADTELLPGRRALFNRKPAGSRGRQATFVTPRGVAGYADLVGISAAWPGARMVIVASFNVENLFARPKEFNTGSWAAGEWILRHYGESKS
jgi:hypothetical protein